MRRLLVVLPFVVVGVVSVALAAGSAEGLQAELAGDGLIAFVRGDAIYVMRADGGGVRAIRRGEALSAAEGLAWSSDGRRLAFVDARDVWVMDADGTDLVSLKLREGLKPWSLTWSPSGERIAFAAVREGENGADVWVVNADGSGLRRLARTPWLSELEVDWGPGGRRIAFIGVGGDWVMRLFVMDKDGRNVRKLSPDGSLQFHDLSPDWSPDGRRIAFTRMRMNGSGSILGAEIWVTGSGGRRRVGQASNGVRDLQPAWSPDGTKIAFVRGNAITMIVAGGGLIGGSSEIYVMNTDGTEVTRLTHTRAGETNPTWQPNPHGR